MVIIILCIGLWYASLFCHSFFLHRYASHRAFSMSRGWERFFFILTYLMQGSSYMSPGAYGIMHRLHHAHTDTELDPHSPHHSPHVLAMVWQSRNVYRGILEGKITVEDKYTKNLPQWTSFDRWATSGASTILWFAIYTLLFILFAPSIWWFLLLPFMAGMAVFQGALVNWYAHKYGYENYEMKNTSKNIFALDIILLGEGYHNNHHKHPSSPNFGKRKFEIDIVYLFIKLFTSIGIIKLTEKQLVK